jgi:hypothetical protein
MVESVPDEHPQYAVFVGIRYKHVRIHEKYLLIYPCSIPEAQPSARKSAEYS